jgi:hypothetical protein
MSTEQIADTIQKEIDRLRNVVNILRGRDENNYPRTFSAETRKTMATAQKKRWAKLKRAA